MDIYSSSRLLWPVISDVALRSVLSIASDDTALAAIIPA